jgi:hypothetical protein
MDNLISIKDFKAPIAIINSDKDTEERVNDVISYAQENYLIRILGALEYNKLNAATLEGDTEWTRFINGVNYTVGGTEYKYGGIKNPLKHLIFYDIQTEFANDPIPLGHSAEQFDKGRKVIPVHRITRSWNYAVDLIQDYDCKQWDFVTVYRFLQDNETDYPEWEYRFFRKLTGFGI